MLLERREIGSEQFAEEVLGRSRDIRFHGTALFVLHEGLRYLLTARHVVHDENSAKRELEEEERRALSLPERMREDCLKSAEERSQNTIFKIIFRVRSIDEEFAQTQGREFLMNLGAGGGAPYTFSDPGLDLALISLDQRNSRFADELQNLEFSPVASDDIADGPNAEGQDVFTIGFPSSTALIGQISQDPALSHWSSSWVSAPVSSFGKVSMLHEALPFFGRT